MLGIALLALTVVRLGHRGGPKLPTFAPGAGIDHATLDPLAYDARRRAVLEARAALGLSHVLYAKSPGGAIATAGRVARWRPLVETVAREHRDDPNLLMLRMELGTAEIWATNIGPLAAIKIALGRDVSDETLADHAETAL